MRKKVFTTMLSLSVCFLVGMYVLKIFFPEEFMMSIQNEKLITIGKFIDNNIFLSHLCSSITMFLVYYLYSSACCRRIKLGFKHIVVILITIILIKVFGFIDTNIASILRWTSFMFIPALCDGNLKIGAFIFTTHSLLQGLSIGIRNLPMYLTDVNSITSLFMVAECYLWLFIMCLIFNFKNKKGE